VRFVKDAKACGLGCDRTRVGRVMVVTRPRGRQHSRNLLAASLLAQSILQTFGSALPTSVTIPPTTYIIPILIVANSVPNKTVENTTTKTYILVFDATPSLFIYYIHDFCIWRCAGRVLYNVFVK
jgi:hypothetical protein